MRPSSPGRFAWAFALLLSLSLSRPAIAEEGPILTVPAGVEPRHLSVAAPAFSAVRAGASLRLVDLGPGSAPIPAGVVADRGADGLPTGSLRVVATIPGAAGGDARRFRLEPAEASSSAFRVADVDEKSVGVWEGDRPVLVYNHGVITRQGAPAQLARSSYVHPVYDLDGDVISDDFPRDHYHHRGLFWAWPHVIVEGKEYDLWLLKGVKPKFERWLARESGPASATLGVENGWYAEDRKLLVERVWLEIHPAVGDARAVDVSLSLEPAGADVTLDGAEGKSYGGLNLRFGPGRDRVITTPLGDGPADLLMKRLPWADMTARFTPTDRRSGAAILVAPDHPEFPPTWLTRHYGALCVGWPGVTPATLPAGRATQLRYRVWIHRDAVDGARLARVADSYHREAAAVWNAPGDSKP